MGEGRRERVCGVRLHAPRGLQVWAVKVTRIRGKAALWVFICAFLGGSHGGVDFFCDEDFRHL